MNKNRLFWGVTFILTAIFLIVGKLGYLEDLSIFSMIFTVFLGAVLVKSIYPVNFAGILFPLAFLGIIYDKQLGIENLTPWTVLAVAALGSIGLSMVFYNKSWCHYHHHGHWGKEFEDFEVIDVEDESHVKQSTSFGASSKYINSEAFKQADLECSFGAMNVYFDHAQVQDSQVLVRVHVSFAGMELYVPKEWAVDNQVRASFGAVEEKNNHVANETVKMVLVGDVSFGAIEITYI